MENVNRLSHIVTVIQANGQSEFESVPIETIEGNSQLWQMLGLGAAQLTAFLEEEILENPFVELDYPREQRPSMAVTLHEHEAIVGVDPQMPEAPHSLPMFLFEQIMMYRRTPIRDAMVHLIDLLDQQGYLPYDYREIATRLDIEEIIALDALTLFKQLEPAGVGAYNLRECLMMQTEQDSYAPNVAYYLLEEYFELLVQEDYATIVAQSGVTMEEVLACVTYYQTLRTQPASLFDVEMAEELLPDLTVMQEAEVLQVRYNIAYYPKVRFNQSYFDEMMATGDSEVVAYCRPHKIGYERLAHNLKVREQIILKVVQAVVAMQLDFVTGQTVTKTPLLLKQLVEVSALPEPIINLVLANKNLAFQQQIVPLTDFITVATGYNREGFTAESIKHLIHDILHRHDASVSDAEIVRLLEEHKIMISELMVHHYRLALGH